MSISFGNNRVTGVGGVIVWTITVGYCRQNAGKSQNELDDSHFAL